MKHFFNISIFLLSLSASMYIKAMNIFEMAQVVMPVTPYSAVLQSFSSNSLVPPHVYNDDIGSIQATILTLTGTIAFSCVSIYYLYDRIKCASKISGNVYNEQCKKLRNRVKTTSFTRGRKRPS